MSRFVLSLVLALSLLLIGGFVPGGTYLITPVASLWLVALAYLGAHGPQALRALIAGNGAPLWRLIQTRFGDGARTLLLLGLPLWLLQCLAGFTGAPAPMRAVNAEPVNGVASTFRPYASPIRIWFEPDQPLPPSRPQRGPGSVHFQTASTSRTVRGQATDGPLGVDFPAASVAWAWADLDLLPDLVVTVGPETGHSSESRTFYVPLTDAAVREQTALSRHLWTAFLLGYPILGMSALAFLAGRLLYRLARLIAGIRLTSR